MAHNVGPIQVALVGLYGMLGVKDGSNPDIITGFVQPTLDATPWWLRALSVPSSESYLLAFTSETFQAPFLLADQNEWLHVEYAKAETVMGGGASNPLIKFVVFLPTPGRIIWDSGYQAHQVVSGAHIASVQVRDIWIPPGYGLLVQVEGGTVGQGVSIGALVTRCRI